MMNFDKVLVIGAGTMGRGIAQWFCQAGCTVHLNDTNGEILAEAEGSIHSSWKKLQEKQKFTPEEVESFKGRIHFSQGNNYPSCNLVIEAIVENPEIKKMVFSEIQGQMPLDTWFASNTSSLSIEELSTSLPSERRSRFIGLHFFNPATIMKLVEIVETTANDRGSIQQIKRWFEAKGKKPAVCQDKPGFIVNRLARHYYGESLRMAWGDHAKNYYEIDNALVLSGGFRLGAFELMDLIGIDVNYKVTETVWKAFGRPPRMEPHPLQKKMVDENKLGIKTGRGFYRPPAKRDKAQKVLDSLPHHSRILVIVNRDHPLCEKLNTINVPNFSVKDVSALESEGNLPECDVIFDLVMTEDKKKRSVIEKIKSKNDKPLISDLSANSSVQLWEEIQGACQLAWHSPVGCQEIWIPEQKNLHFVLELFGLLDLKALPSHSPGFVLPRIVSLLVNETLLAEEDKLGEPQDLDRAMKFGVNYPLGPYEWLGKIGKQSISLLLKNYEKNLGTRYQQSILLNKEVL